MCLSEPQIEPLIWKSERLIDSERRRRNQTDLTFVMLLEEYELLSPDCTIMYLKICGKTIGLIHNNTRKHCSVPKCCPRSNADEAKESFENSSKWTEQFCGTLKIKFRKKSMIYISKGKHMRLTLPCIALGIDHSQLLFIWQF